MTLRPGNGVFYVERFGPVGCIEAYPWFGDWREYGLKPTHWRVLVIIFGFRVGRFLRPMHWYAAR